MIAACCLLVSIIRHIISWLLPWTVLLYMTSIGDREMRKGEKGEGKREMLMFRYDAAKSNASDCLQMLQLHGSGRSSELDLVDSNLVDSHLADSRPAELILRTSTSTLLTRPD